MSWIDLAGHLSFVLTAASFTLRDMMLLRGISILSGIVGIVYNYNLPGGPLWLVIFWLGVFMAINLFQMGRLILERRCVALSEEDQALVKKVFPDFSAVEVGQLMRIAEWRTLPEDHTPITQGEHPADMLLLYNGEMTIVRDDAEIACVRSGAFVGEMAFISGREASATVRARSVCRCVAWSQAKLAKLLKNNPALHARVHQVLAADLSQKIYTPALQA